MRRIAILTSLLLCAGAAPAATVEVRVEGLDDPLEENVRAFLGLVARSEAQEDPEDEEEELPPLGEGEIRQLHRQAPDEIRQALQPFGYYSPQVDGALERTDDGWVATYRVEPGEPTRIGHVEIRVEGEAADLPEVQAQLEGIDIAEGQVVSHPAYARAKDGLMQAVYSAGFLDAEYERSELRVYPERRRAEIYLVLESGPRYYFGDVEIEQSILDPDFVSRFNDIERGEPFDTERLIDLQLGLSGSDYFGAVDVNIEREQANDFHVPVTVTAEPRDTQRYSVGLGYGTDTGPRLTLGTEFRRINRRGHQFNADVQLSQVRNSFIAQYHIPIENVAADRLTFFASLQQIEIGDADSNVFSIGASREDDWHGLRRRLYLRYDRETFHFGDQPGGDATLLYPGINLSWQRADDTLFPRRGVSASLDVHGAPESPLAETTFLQATLGVRAVLPLGARARLLLRGETGITEAEDFADLPPTQRFFTGGDRTVRGYGYQELSPENEFGDDVGGRYLTVASVEVDYLVFGNFGLAAFFDTGNATNTSPGDNLVSSVGLGLRYRSPVGMIRVDFAHPLDDPSRDFRLHISLGPDL
ncbi:MAG TPA: autotransporter assembly complex family protein [Woeseiaceae bacterium]|nr:autotransporter assembly complex family protein [Woeseiaceae bacterium]